VEEDRSERKVEARERRKRMLKNKDVGVRECREREKIEPEEKLVLGGRGWSKSQERK